MHQNQNSSTTGRTNRVTAASNDRPSDRNPPGSFFSPSRNISGTTRNINLHNRRTTARLSMALRSSPNSIIMTKAQQRRRYGLLASPSNFVRAFEPQGDGQQLALTPTPEPIHSRDLARYPLNNGTRRRSIPASSSSETTESANTGDEDSSAGYTFESPDRMIPRRIRHATRLLSRVREFHGDNNSPSPAQNLDNTIEVPSASSASPSPYSYTTTLRRARNKVTFDLGGYQRKDAVTKVLTSEKILPRIFQFMNWNELMSLRSLCKLWFEVIELHPKLNSKLGVIVLRSSAESKMVVYNKSNVIWKKFRFIGPIIFDMTKPIQNEFWNKHGPLMVHLDIYNRAMSLTALVEILAKCNRLEYFKCNWTPEMYSFNSDLIKKYYGIHFNNGTFANLKELTIESSSSLTDNALWSILKWCGGSIKTLKLTSTPDEDILNRLKPRWSTDSLKNYFDRFGYTGNLQYLDFSWSNLVNDDMQSLCSISANLKGITLNYCKLDDDALRKLLVRHGEFLEVFKIEGTSFTDTIFVKGILRNVKVLHIGGLKGTVRNLEFLEDMPFLEDLSCRNTQWLQQSMILRPFNSMSKQRLMKAIDFSGGVKYTGNKNLDPNLNKTWFSDFTGLLANLKELNLSNWSSFGTNQNFRNICHSLISLQKLKLREWEQLNDVATTGLNEEEIHHDWGMTVPQRSRVYIGSLKDLKHLDLSGTSITDATIFLALVSLKNLRSIALDNTRVTDNGLRGIIDLIPTIDRISVHKCSRISMLQPRFKRTDGRMVFFGKL